MDESGIKHNRRSRRSPVLLTASLDVGDAREPVRLRNLSAEGALVEGERLPPEGALTVFRRKELYVPARVAWVEGRFAGVAFATPLEKEQLLRHVPPPRPRVAPIFRRPGLACRPLTDEERRTIEVWMTQLPVVRPGD